MADTTIRGLTGGDSGQPAADAWLISQATSTATTPLAHSFSAMGGMVHAANTLTTGNLTASVGTLHLLTIAGLTAIRDFILPDTAAVGERVGLYIVDGDATYEVAIKTAATGSLLNGTGHSSTAYTHVFILGEVMIFECINGGGAGDTDWIAAYDGRIPCRCTIADGSAATNHYVNNVQTQCNFDTAVEDNGGLADLANDQLKVRRDSIYVCVFSCTTPTLFTDNEIAYTKIYMNASAKTFRAEHMAFTGTAHLSLESMTSGDISAGQTIYATIQQVTGADMTWTTGTAFEPRLEVTEILAK